MLFGAAAVAKGGVIKTAQRLALVAASLMLLAGGIAAGAIQHTRPVKPHLEIAATTTAKNIAFDTKCLAAPAGQGFTIDFENQDAGVPHNVDVYAAAPPGGSHLAGAKDASDVLIGPGKTTYDVQSLKAGTYYFQCDIHPTQMFGTFVVK